MCEGVCVRVCVYICVCVYVRERETVVDFTANIVQKLG